MVFSALLYSRLLDTPLVASYHTHVPEYIKSYTWRGLAEPMWAMIRTWTRLSNTMLVTSAVMQGELAKHACRARHLALWRRGVDVDIFNPGFRSAAMRDTLSGGHPTDPLLVCVGRLGAEKNLASLRDVLAANPGARLALVGDGPQRQQLEAHFAGTPTVFTGMLSGTALSAAYASADIFVMPSETETLGFVVLEAMASGVPVVAVAAGGIPDIITTPGTTGLLYPPGDVAAAAAAVRRLIQDPEMAASVGEAGRQDVSRFGWPAASRHLREVLYSQAIRRARAIRRFRRLAARVTQQRVAAAALLSLLSSQRVYHAAAALACGALVAAVASTAPMGAMSAMAALPLEVPAGAAYLALVIAAGGALPLVPFQPLALLAGYSFGVVHGALIVAVGVLGASIASATCFRLFNGGHLLREHLPLGRVRPFLAHQLRAVAAAVQRGSFSRGTAAVAALRLRPLAPFSLSSYLTLDAGIKPIAFVTGTVLGMAPHCALYAAAGAAWRLHVASGRPVVRLLSSALDALQQQHVLAVQAAAALLMFATVQALYTMADEYMRTASRRQETAL
jgi:sulfoquinovosyltransferase